ncbi:MAG: hypothetical protein LBM96_04860 [Methanobrevibacter sp.]|jgi:hypothetical protein|nr:hypothetical protein [Candidatus Methanoflexus mossambicus]
MLESNFTIQIIATFAAIFSAIAAITSAYVAYKNFKVNQKTQAINEVKETNEKKLMYFSLEEFIIKIQIEIEFLPLEIERSLKSYILIRLINYDVIDYIIEISSNNNYIHLTKHSIELKDYMKQINAFIVDINNEISNDFDIENIESYEEEIADITKCVFLKIDESFDELKAIKKEIF